MGALVSVVTAWAIAALAGGWVATRTATRAKLSHAIIFGTLFLAATITILLHLPHPLWMWVTGIVVILPAAYLGGRLGLPRVAGQELPGAGKLT